MNSIAFHLQRFRRNRKISAKEMGVRLGVTRQHVYRIEKGATTSIELAEKIASEMGIPLASLFTMPKKRTA